MSNSRRETAAGCPHNHSARYAPPSLWVCLLAAQLSFGALAAAQDINLADLGTIHPGFVVQGLTPDSGFGITGSGAGDVNGDGLADLLVGPSFEISDSGIAARESIVVFGKTDTGGLSFSNLGDAGFRIGGFSDSSYYGFDVSGGGDVNGDGLADVLIAADNYDTTNSTVYVVFGKTSTESVSITALADGGFTISAEGITDSDDLDVKGAGDVNGDGFADVLLGMPYVSNNGYADVGVAFVVFGRTGTKPVFLSDLAGGGFAITGYREYGLSGLTVSGAGDMNGDGLADVLISDTTNAGSRQGEAFVVFGKTNTQSVDLAELGEAGFQIIGNLNDYSANWAVSGAGDFNGDGFADVIIGSDRARPGGRVDAGEAYIVFGKTDSAPVDLSTGFGHLVIEGTKAGDGVGYKVAGAGDVNGDGLADVLVLDFKRDAAETESPQRSFVVYGTTETKPITPDDLGAGGFLINGVPGNYDSGGFASSAGDVNGDGLSDLLLGAWLPDGQSRSNRGDSYVVFSPASAPPSATYLTYSGTNDPPSIAIGISGNGSNDSTPDARVWIDFADGELPSLQTVRLFRSNNGITGISNVAPVVWQITSDRLAWIVGRVEFKYLDSEVASLNEGTLRIFSSPDADGPWTPLPELTRNPANNTIAGGVSSFSYFVLADDTVLSVELAEFRALVVAGGIEVSWTTLLEDETAGFFLRRAVPSGGGGTSVGARLNSEVVVAQGSGSYTLLDSQGTPDSLYYLEEITVDGSTKYYGPVGASSRNATVAEWMSF